MVWAPENLFKRHLPFSLLTGFLGSGKTTLLNGVLRDPRLADTAIAINEFGDIALDQDFITASNEDVIVLANGCMCCAATDDLSAALEKILTRGADGTLPEFKRLIIETSGIADPEMVLQSIIDNPIAARFLWLDSIVTTVDAIYGLEQLDTHGEAMKQARLADRIVITKADLVGPERLAQVRAALARINPRAEQITGQADSADVGRLFSPFFFADHDADSFIGAWVGRQAELGGGEDQAHAHRHHDDACCCHDGHGHAQECAAHGHSHAHRARPVHTSHAHSVGLTAEQPVDWRQFSLWLGRQQRAYGSRLLRVKGILDVIGSEEPVVIHAVQTTTHVPVSLRQWPGGRRGTRLVFILHDETGEAVRASWLEFLAEHGGRTRKAG